MRVLSLIHQKNAAAGVMGECATADGHDVEEASLALGRPPSLPVSEYDAVMVFGGSMNVDETSEHPWLDEERSLIAEAIASRHPLLGVCLGAQLVAEVAGGKVGPLPGGREIGWHEVELLAAANGDPLLGGLESPLVALEWHGYAFGAPPGAAELARGTAGLQAFRVGDAPAWGIQFHAEVTAADAYKWIDDYRTDEDAVRIGVDPRLLRVETEERIERFNQLGRELCGRWLDAVG
jgi:GMP synthase (glutamine-hydrolysing)